MLNDLGDGPSVGRRPKIELYGGKGRNLIGELRLSHLQVGDKPLTIDLSHGIGKCRDRAEEYDTGNRLRKHPDRPFVLLGSFSGCGN